MCDLGKLCLIKIVFTREVFQSSALRTSLCNAVSPSLSLTCTNSERDLNILLLMLVFFFRQFLFIEPLVLQHIPKQKGSVCYAKHTVHDWHLRPIDLPITTISPPPQALLQRYWFKHCRSVSIFWFWAGQLRKWVIVITLLQDQLHLMQDKVLLLEQRKENDYDQEHFTAEHAANKNAK